MILSRVVVKATCKQCMYEGSLQGRIQTLTYGGGVQSFGRNVNGTLRSSRKFSFNQKISSVPLSLVSPGKKPDAAASKILCS